MNCVDSMISNFALLKTAVGNLQTIIMITENAEYFFIRCSIIYIQIPGTPLSTICNDYFIGTCTFKAASCMPS